MSEVVPTNADPESDGRPLPLPGPSDRDPLLEAERTVRELAEELGRMRSAASLLEASQQKVDGLLRASEAVVQSAGRFTDDSVAILQRLQAIDLESRLGEVNRKAAETQELLGRQLDRLNEALEQLRARSQEDAGSLREEFLAALRSTSEEIQKASKAQSAHVAEAVGAAREGMRGDLASLRKLTVGLGAATVLLLIVLIVLAVAV